MFIFHLNFDFSDILQGIDILITSGLILLVSVYINGRFNKAKSQKDFFISEIIDIYNDEIKIYKKITDGQAESKFIQNSLKVIAIRIENLEKILTENFKDINSNFLNSHNEFKQYISKTKSFNNQFQQTSIVFNGNEQIEIIKSYSNLLTAKYNLILSIHVAKLKK